MLARGAGTRMQAVDGSAALTDAQARAAAAGHKALMPIGGRPFLDHVLAALAEAGVTDVALVVAPDHAPVRAAYPEGRGPAGVRVSCVVQAEPRGTADAVLAAETWAGDEPFLVLNGDNLYPVPALRTLCEAPGPATAGFDRASLEATSNIPPDRIAAFALVDADPSGALRDITEKPSAAVVDAAGPHALVSMNLWRFDARIFGACRDVAPSPRGEWELPSAVRLAVARGVRVDVLPALGPVLDLSRRGDVADVARRLASGAGT